MAKIHLIKNESRENSGKWEICWWEYNRHAGVDHRDFFDADNDKDALRWLGQGGVFFGGPEYIMPDEKEKNLLRNAGYDDAWYDTVEAALADLREGNGDGNDAVYYIRRPDGTYLFDARDDYYFKSIQAHWNLRSSNEDYEADNVKDAKECKAALDKLIVGSDKLKDYGLETVLTEDASVGAEMPVARVELGIRAEKGAEPYYKAGDLLEYYTFDFSGGMCHITFHLQEEDWDEMLSDHPSVTAMIEDLAPDMIDELENHDFVNRPGDEN